MRQLAERNKVVNRWREIERKIADIAELVSMAVQEEDATLKTEIQSEIDEVASRLDALDLEAAFSS